MPTHLGTNPRNHVKHYYSCSSMENLYYYWYLFIYFLCKTLSYYSKCDERTDESVLWTSTSVFHFGDIGVSAQPKLKRDDNDTRACKWASWQCSLSLQAYRHTTGACTSMLPVTPARCASTPSRWKWRKMKRWNRRSKRYVPSSQEISWSVEQKDLQKNGNKSCAWVMNSILLSAGLTLA